MSNVNTKSGNTGGLTKTVNVTPAISAGLYSALENVGGVNEIADIMSSAGETGILQTIKIIDSSSTPQSAALIVDVFSSQPSTTGKIDNAAYAIQTTDKAMFLARISVTADDYVNIGGVSIATMTGLGIPINSATGTASLWFSVATPTGSTPTYSSTSALIFSFGVLCD